MRRSRLTTLAVSSSLVLGACDLVSGSKPANELAETKSAKTVSSTSGKLCGSNTTYAKLKDAAFDEAKRVREKESASLDALASASVVRMENPLLENRDDALDLTVCSGRMVLELPPGAATAFGGRQRLAADITYSAQGAADGSGAVYKLDGAEPIVYRLASFDARRGSVPAPMPSEQVATLDAPEVDPDVATDSDLTMEPIFDRSRQADRTSQEVSRATPPRSIKSERARPRLALPQTTSPRATTPRSTSPQAVPPRPTRQASRGTIQRPSEDRVARSSTGSSSRPSFNCRYARSRVEKTICGSDDLAARDRGMSALYFRTNARVDAVAKQQLATTRDRFLAARDRCGSEACIADTYDQRVDEIREIEAESD